MNRLYPPVIWLLAGLGFLGTSCAEKTEVASDGGLVKVDHNQLKQILTEADDSVKLVNFWATWCAPCRQEFPDLVRIGRDFADQGVEVVFVSTDVESAWPQAEAFLEEQGVASPAYVIDGNDYSFMQAFDVEWAGELPATFLFDGQGALKDFWVGRATYDEIQRRLTKMLTS